jgi:hypothetical protein
MQPSAANGISANVNRGPIPAIPTNISPYLGEWILDQISISRNKLSRLLLGEDGVKKLWACGSIEELRQVAADDPGPGEQISEPPPNSIGESAQDCT